MIIEIYDYDENLNERFKGLKFCDGEGMEKSHGYSYLHCRRIYQEMGEVMSLDNENKQENKV